MNYVSQFFFRGRAGLAAILNAIGLEDGDEVITQAFTCVAVPEGIIAAGGKPIFADLRVGSVNMDPSDVARKITVRTKAIIVQHTFGYAGPLREVLKLTKECNILVIEDCCHTFSTTIGDRTVGLVGDASFFSFEWGKPLPCGVGGAAYSSNAAVNKKILDQRSKLQKPSFLRRLRLELQYYGFALCYRPKTYWAMKSIFKGLSRAGAAEGNFGDLNFEVPSDDFRLDIGPAVARRVISEFKNIPLISEHANSVASAYRSLPLARDLTRVADESAEGSVLARYPLWADNKSELLDKAKRSHVELADWYKTPVHPLSASQQPSVNYLPGSCPIAEAACEKIVSLPTNRFVNTHELNKIAALVAR